ncbi:MAG: M56 family metallopeptidase [Oleispira sp.]
MPWLLSLSCFALVLQDDLLVAENSPIQQFFHWHHRFSFSWKSWHGLSLIASILVSIYLCHKAFIVALKYKKQDAKRRTLSLLTCNQQGHFEHTQALAFTSGLLTPKAYISTGLAKELSSEELVIVELHEQAHANSYDPLQKWLFLLAASFFPNIIARQLVAAMDLTLELRADNKVTKQFSVLDVAEALIKVARVMGSSSQQLQQRLHYLIAPQKGFLLEELWKPIALLMLQLILPVLTIIFAMDFFHHLLDQWLWHFSE